MIEKWTVKLADGQNYTCLKCGIVFHTRSLQFQTKNLTFCIDFFFVKKPPLIFTHVWQ